MERDWYKLLFSFEGRIGRKDWWIVYIINIVISFAIGLSLVVFTLGIGYIDNMLKTPSSIILAVMLGSLLFVLLYGYYLVLFCGIYQKISRQE